MTADNDSTTPEFAIEFHYADGDVGVYPVQPDSPEAALWGQFPPAVDSTRPQPSHIVIRPNDDAGQDISNRLYAAGQALHACLLLVDAYARGAQNGGSVDWSDIDEAHEAAREAIRRLRATTDELPRNGDREQADEPEPPESCRHEWITTGTAYGGDDASYRGEGRCICRLCGMDGDG